MNIIVSRNDDGFLAQLKGVQGGFADGETPYEAIYNLMDVMDLISSYKNKQFASEKFSRTISFDFPEFA